MKLYQLTADEINHVVTGQRAIQDKLTGSAGAGAEMESISASGALDPLMPISALTVSGTKAYTLADGTFAGQEKRIVCVSAASTPLGTLTIATPETATGLAVSATHIFTSAGQVLFLVWTGTKWQCRGTSRAGVQVLVIGTTATAGMTLAHMYDCQVTATVNSTGANALPNGQYPGDRCIIGCSVFASTPVGSIDGVFLTTASAAATHLQAIGAAADTVTLEWNGTAWVVAANVGITVA